MKKIPGNMETHLDEGRFKTYGIYVMGTWKRDILNPQSKAMSRVLNLIYSSKLFQPDSHLASQLFLFLLVQPLDR